MNIKVNAKRNVAVNQDVFWLPMSSCPKGVKVHVLGPGDVSTQTVWDGKDMQWKGWQGMFKKPDWMVLGLTGLEDESQ